MQAVLIVAHTGIEQLRKLSLVLSEKFEVFIHFDLSKKLTKEQIDSFNKEHIHFYQKYEVKWGGWSLSAATQFLMRKALDYPEISYFHLISGQDWPTIAIEKLYDFYDNNNNIYMLYAPAKDTIKSGQNCLNWQKFFYYFDKINRRTTHGKIIHRLLYYTQQLFRVDKLKRLGIDCEIYQGPNWVDLPRSALQYALDYFDSHENIRKLFRTGYCPDEFWLQTILCNSIFKKNIKQDYHRYIVWEKIHGSYPAILDDRDYTNIINGDYHFMRKIVFPISESLIERIIDNNK